jgi:hypothetical protein
MIYGLPTYDNPAYIDRAAEVQTNNAALLRTLAAIGGPIISTINDEGKGY